MDLSNNVPGTASSRLAIVTGGAGGSIGGGVSEVLARQHWNVLVVEKDEQAARALVERLTQDGRSVRAVFVDLVRDDAPRRVVEAALAWKGCIDGLVNNAGIGLTKPFAQISDEDYDRLMGVNLRAVFRLSRAVLEELVKTRGAIVNLASIMGRRPLPAYAVYAASKAGVEGLTRGMAVEYGPRGVRINCVVPGLVDGPQTRNVLAQSVDDPAAFIDQWISHVQLLPRLAASDDVGELVAFLLGDKARAITGQSFVIDAGTLTMLAKLKGV